MHMISLHVLEGQADEEQVADVGLPACPDELCRGPCWTRSA